jgi:DNA repair protein RecN (Recombination protein N)
MLRTLTIRNLAVVDDVQVGFSEGLNVITGETGAGKSLLIGALRLLMGERADRSMIRTGEESCMVLAEFGLHETQAVDQVLISFGLEPCEGGLLIIRRVISEHSSRNLVNDEPVTLQVLKELGAVLVDMHGPYDHQSLLDSAAQRDILDAFGGLTKKREEYQAIYSRWKEVVDTIDRLRAGSEEEYQRQIEFLSYRIDEVERANLSAEEREEIERDHTQAANLQTLTEQMSIAIQALSEGESAVYERLCIANQAIEKLQDWMPSAADWSAELDQTITSIQELVRSLEVHASDVDMSPERMQWLDDRLTTYQTLERKYGGSVSNVLSTCAEWKEQLHELQSRETRLNELDQDQQQHRQQLDIAGEALHVAREEAADHLSERITRELVHLGFEHGFFDVTLHKQEPSLHGMDAIEFGFAPNAGEQMRPLRTIASSGEISRVMLAVKSVLAQQDQIPVLVFDEIDANIGGEIGRAVGRKLAEVGRLHQLVCITHLPQVAACGNCHLAVTKYVDAGRTFTEVRRLDEQSRPVELARMLGGEDSGGVSLEHAKTMLQQQMDL